MRYAPGRRGIGIILGLLAYALLTVLRAYADRPEGRPKGNISSESIPLTVPEVRRPVLAMGEPDTQRRLRIGW